VRSRSLTGATSRQPSAQRVWLLVDSVSKEEQMDPVSFDALTRRASLISMGAAGLVAFAQPDAAKSKKKHKKKKGDVNKLCKEEVSDCLAVLTAVCEDAACVAVVQLCCPKLATCDFAGHLNCVLTNQ
jgi:hypothetical protein